MFLEFQLEGLREIQGQTSKFSVERAIAIIIKDKGHATNMARQRQIKSHKLQVGIPVPKDLPAFFLLLKELNETVHCGLITLQLSAKESTR